MLLPWLVFNWLRKANLTIPSDNDGKVDSTPPAAQRKSSIGSHTRGHEEEDETTDGKDGATDGKDANGRDEEYEAHKEDDCGDKEEHGENGSDNEETEEKDVERNAEGDGGDIDDNQRNVHAFTRLVTGVSQHANPVSEESSQSSHCGLPSQNHNKLTDDLDESDIDERGIEDVLKRLKTTTSEKASNRNSVEVANSSEVDHVQVSGDTAIVASESISSSQYSHDDPSCSSFALAQLSRDETNMTQGTVHSTSVHDVEGAQSRQQVPTQHRQTVDLGLKILLPSYDENATLNESRTPQKQSSPPKSRGKEPKQLPLVFNPSMKAINSIGRKPNANVQKLPSLKSVEASMVTYTDSEYLERNWSLDGAPFHPWEHFELAKCMARQHKLRPIPIPRFVEMATKDVNKFMYKMYIVAICNTGVALRHLIYKESLLIELARLPSKWEPPSIYMTPLVLPMYFSYVQLCENTKTKLLPFPGTNESREFMKLWTEQKLCPFGCTARRYYGVEGHMVRNHYKNGRCDGCQQLMNSASDFLLHAVDCPNNSVETLSGMEIEEEFSESDEVSIVAIADKRDNNKRQRGTDTEDESIGSKVPTSSQNHSAKPQQPSESNRLSYKRRTILRSPSYSSPQKTVGESTILNTCTPSKSPTKHSSQSVPFQNSLPIAKQSGYKASVTQNVQRSKTNYPVRSLIHVPASPAMENLSVGPLLSEVDISEAWRCPYPYCGAIFDENYMLMLHLDLHAERRMAKYSCPYVKLGLCEEEIVANKAQFEEHMELAHYDPFAEGYSAGKCKHCRKTFASVDSFLSHTGECVSTYTSLQRIRNERQNNT